MANAELSPEARQFLRTHIQSLEQLEILAVMRAERGRDWSSEAIYDSILSNEKSIIGRLAQFESVGLVTSNKGQPLTYRYSPSYAALDAAVEATLQAYRERRVTVIETIFRPDADPAKSFADAFRFKHP